MSVKRYKVVHDETSFEMVVEIDHSVFGEASLKEINNFWSGADERLDDEDGDILTVVLKMLCRRVIYLQFEYGYTTEGLVSLFDFTRGEGQEGWPKMDGTEGIKIVSVDVPEIYSHDMRIQVMQL